MVVTCCKVRLDDHALICRQARYVLISYDKSIRKNCVRLR
jgi:hypothetical protein